MSFQVTYVNPGDKLWYIVRGNRRVGDIIVPVTVTELDDIYSSGSDLPSIWHYRFLDEKEDYVSMATDKKNENGWPIWERKDKTFLNGLERVNQLVWIDEPVGHAISIDTYDGLFLTLHEAQRHARPSKKKHLTRRLRASRGRTHRFIASTWKNVGETHPGFSKLPDKKIYVRKK